MKRISVAAFNMALSVGLLLGGMIVTSNDITLKDDPFSRQSRSKGEKARNKKLRGRV